jgi:hypothetical protein
VNRPHHKNGRKSDLYEDVERARHYQQNVARKIDTQDDLDVTYCRRLLYVGVSQAQNDCISDARV